MHGAVSESEPKLRAELIAKFTKHFHEVFEGIDDPRWDGGDATHPLMVKSERFEPMRKITNSNERIV